MTKRRSPAALMPVIMTMLELIGPYVEHAEVAGSVRRNAASVKDVELVILPKDELYDVLDSWITIERISYKLYGEGDKARRRWGRKARGLVFNGVTFEFYMADPDNYGYQLWLRTGPKEGNQYLLGHIKRAVNDCPVEMREGYIWDKATGERLRISTEADFFGLLGLPELPPDKRQPGDYKAHLNTQAHAWRDPSAYLPAPEVIQNSLFGLEPDPAPAVDVGVGSASGRRKKAPADQSRSSWDWEPCWYAAPGAIWYYAGYGRWQIVAEDSEPARRQLRVLQDHRHREPLRRQLDNWLEHYRVARARDAAFDLLAQFTEVLHDND